MMRFTLMMAATLPTAGSIKLGRGWNLGNTLESTIDNPNGEWIFKTVKAKGFDWVRIPIKWDNHTATESPYRVDPAWLATVNETVNWAFEHGLKVMINTHHENWLDNETNFPRMLPRLVAIWKQVAAHFSSVTDDQLVFELLNEPANINIDQLNQMNAALLPVIRPTNPTRQIHFGGLRKMGAWWIIQPQHQDAVSFPKNDAHLALTVHSYAPYSFAGPKPSLHAYTLDDLAKAEQTMSALHDWSQKHAIPVALDEFGCTVQQTNNTARLLYFKTASSTAMRHGIDWAVWDDNGWFQILNRKTQQWDTEVLRQLFAE
jgi:aryl-phospho-beta-D-glucosidase BglC (GH1 family)